MTGCQFTVGQSASIRGVPFHIATGQEAGGHRKIDHAYPNRDEHDFEDLGLKADTFDIKGHITDLDAAANKVRAMRNALKAKGECSFYHPLIDEMFQVEIFDWTLDSKKDEVGRIAFSFKAKKVSPDKGGDLGMSPVSAAAPGAALSAVSSGLQSAMSGHLA